MQTQETAHKRLLTATEAVTYQRDVYGRVAYGRATLYAMARSGEVDVIRNGNRTLFPVRVLDKLLGA